MTVKTNVRNVLVIALLAGVVYAFGTTGDVALNTLVTAITLAFFAGFAWVASRMYREHRVDLYGLGNRRRATLYIALGVGALTLTAYDRLTQTGFGTVIWLVLLGCCIYALYAVWRSSREY